MNISDIRHLYNANILPLFLQISRRRGKGLRRSTGRMWVYSLNDMKIRVVTFVYSVQSYTLQHDYTFLVIQDEDTK